MSKIICSSAISGANEWVARPEAKKPQHVVAELEVGEAAVAGREVGAVEAEDCERGVLGGALDDDHRRGESQNGQHSAQQEQTAFQPDAPVQVAHQD